MNRYGPRRKGLPASQCLTVNDVLFINEYMANGRNATQAYSKVHTKAAYQTCNVEAQRVLQKPSVVAEIARQVRAAGLTREMIMSDLVYARDLAHKAQDYSALASISLDCAKLAGFLIERQEVKTVSESDQAPIRQLVASSLTQVQSG